MIAADNRTEVEFVPVRQHARRFFSRSIEVTTTKACAALLQRGVSPMQPEGFETGLVEIRAARLDMCVFDSWPEADKTAIREMFGILDEAPIRFHFAAGTHYDDVGPTDDVSPERVRLYRETKTILTRLSTAIVAPIAHHLIQTLETFIPIEPSEVFALIAQAVKSAEQGGYSNE